MNLRKYNICMIQEQIFTRKWRISDLDSLGLDTVALTS
jgi:hypothetical protein